MTSAYHFRGWAYVEAFRAAGLERSADAAFRGFVAERRGSEEMVALFASCPKKGDIALFFGMGD